EAEAAAQAMVNRLKRLNSGFTVSPRGLQWRGYVVAHRTALVNLMETVGSDQAERFADTLAANFERTIETNEQAVERLRERGFGAKMTQTGIVVDGRLVWRHAQGPVNHRELVDTDARVGKRLTLAAK